DGPDRVVLRPLQFCHEIAVIRFVGAPIKAVCLGVIEKGAPARPGPLRPSVASLALGLADLVQLGKPGALKAEVADDAGGLKRMQVETRRQPLDDPAAALLPGVRGIGHVECRRRAWYPRRGPHAIAHLLLLWLLQ